MAQSTHSIRSDIQGLRAIAVLLVLAFHVWPSWLPGGYIGVDVFFVISGFLITGLLLRELASRGRLSLADFYARRVRRLLPAASLTLAAVALLAVLCFPAGMRRDVAAEGLASALYVENLLLVQRAVDYLALDSEPSPLSHFWSLSVEEQFYVLWPLTIVVVSALARRLGWSTRRALAWALSLVTLASFACAPVMARTSPAAGYFLTTTRLWELGIGGLLAMVDAPRALGAKYRELTAGAGLSCIVVAATCYDTATPFPGHAALLPTLGTALVLFAGVPAAGPGSLLLANRAMRYVGDLSYSLYLWHWPVVVAYPHVTARNLSTPADAALVVVLSFVLAHVSKVHVEDRFRAPVARTRALSTFAAFTGLALATALVAFLSVPESSPQALAAGRDRARYPGAEAFVSTLAVPKGLPIYPSPSAPLSDRAAQDRQADEVCVVGEGSALRVCSRGLARGRYHVALVGDSHAADWLPAFTGAANTGGWRMSALTKLGCPFTDTPVARSAQIQVLHHECHAWVKNAQAWLLSRRPDLVVLNMAPRHALLGKSEAESRVPIARGVIKLVRQLEQAGIEVAAIRRTPWQRAGLSCLTQKAGNELDCAGRASEVLEDGPLDVAARLHPSLASLDFDAAFCQAGLCPQVIGNVLVYRDRHHLTHAFATTLAEPLHARISARFPHSRRQ